MWAPQARKMWKEIGKACGWKHPRAPAVRWLWEEKATKAVLSFLTSTRVGEMVDLRKLSENGLEESEESETDGDEGGPGPP